MNLKHLLTWLKSVKGNKMRLFQLAAACVAGFMLFTLVTRNLKFVGGFPMLKAREKAVEKKGLADIPVPVKAYKIAPVDFTDTLPALGTVKGYREIQLKFSEAGYVEYVNFKDGEKVVEGDIIASLDQRTALLKLEYAKNELEKSQKLFELGAIVELKLNQSKLEYQSARMEYEKTNLIAPYDGYVGAVEAEKGDFLTPTDVVGTFVNLTDAYVEFGIIEKDISKIKVGQEVSMGVDSYPQDVFNGEIESVSPVVEGKSRTFKIRARITNEEEKLKAGLFGRVGVLIYEKPNAIIIPSSALKKKENEFFVYVIHPEEPEPPAENPSKKKGKEKAKKPRDGDEGEAGPGEPAAGAPADLALSPEAPGAGDEPQEEQIIYGTVEIRPIQIAYTTPDAVELKAGLEEGELIVAEVQQEFEEKARVEVTEVQENVF